MTRLFVFIKKHTRGTKLNMLSIILFSSLSPQIVQSDSEEAGCDEGTW